LPLSIADRALRLDGLRGELSLQIERADLDNGWPTELQGTASVSNLLIRALAATPVGSYRAEFQTTDDGITGSVEDTGGVLEVAGTLRLAPDRSYALIGRVGARGDAPSSVTEQLRFLGSPDARGLREFRFEGSL
jgi:general secretion pathway protein N